MKSMSMDLIIGVYRYGTCFVRGGGGAKVSYPNIFSRKSSGFARLSLVFAPKWQLKKYLLGAAAPLAPASNTPNWYQVHKSCCVSKGELYKCPPTYTNDKIYTVDKIYVVVLVSYHFSNHDALF